MSRLSRIGFRAAQRQYDNMCPSEPMSTCDCCGRSKDYGKTFDNSRFICEECLPDVCSKCGDGCPEHFFIINGKVFCNACAETENETQCIWCGSTEGCDCQERMNCDKAGEVGHSLCGKHPCGCPKFVHPLGHCSRQLTPRSSPGRV